MNSRVYSGTGGRNKSSFMSNKTELVGVQTPTSPTIAKVLKSLHILLCKRYRVKKHSPSELLPSASQDEGWTSSTVQSATVDATQCDVLDKHEELLALLHEALTNHPWPDKCDPAVAQEPLKKHLPSGLARRGQGLWPNIMVPLVRRRRQSGCEPPSYIFFFCICLHVYPSSRRVYCYYLWRCPVCTDTTLATPSFILENR